MATFSLSKNNSFNYDIEKKTLSRLPTSSNMKEKGSDNSLYFGMTSNAEVKNIFCRIFDVNDIDEIQGKTFKMKFYSLEVDTVLNINKEGQIQIKMGKNGIMNKLFQFHIYHKMKSYNEDYPEILFDFLNNKISFCD